MPKIVLMGIINFIEAPWKGEAMQGFREEYLVDDQGKRKAVVVPISAWEEIVEALEELDDIRAYEEARKEPSEIIGFEQAVSEIDEGVGE
ncbi:MAG: hypothetical protein ACP5SH_03970 [Syntrophobacteraceae bacterium]